jgi:Xaa-Pro aminopeptidase
LSDFGQDDGSGVIFIDPSTLNANVYKYICGCFTPDAIVSGTSPVILEKAVKTDSEIAAMRQTYIEDGVAMERFLH